jgi:hypothetical protein
MCGGGGGGQTVTQKTELDPALRRMLYGGTIANPRGGFGSGGGSSGGSDAAVDTGGGSDNENDNDNYFDAIHAGNIDPYGGGSPSQGGFTGSMDDYMSGGGMYAMGGMVQPQQGIASLNQGQMPMMGGQLPNLSDPMTAATLAMAVRNPQMQYGNIMAPPAGFKVGGYVEGPGTGTSDSIDAVIMQNGMPVQEALLSDGEFVMTESAVRGAGNGDREKGAAKMYEMMRQFERGGRV